MCEKMEKEASGLSILFFGADSTEKNSEVSYFYIALLSQYDYVECDFGDNMFKCKEKHLLGRDAL
jgi:hypothetical protein